MAELADAPDLGSGRAIYAGSTPVTRTINKQKAPIWCFFIYGAGSAGVRHQKRTLNFKNMFINTATYGKL